MQQLPSGLPSTIPVPPPPPPPPRLPIAAFTTAAANAALYPPSRRRPTLHIIVVHGSATVPILRHAHHALCALSAKGAHVFLQTEVERIGTPALTPITPDVVPDVIAACAADFIVLIADRNVPSRTAQVRLTHNAEFVDVPLSNLTATVLAAWTQRVRTVPDGLQQTALAFNPNVVTTSHLDLLLQSHSSVTSIRRSYARLARLANVTQDWVQAPDLETQAEKDDEEENEGSKSETDPATTPAGSEVQEEQRSEQSESDVAGAIPEIRLLEALREGLQRISAARKEEKAEDYADTSKSDVTFCWLKRSESMSARLLRSQFQACELHRELKQSIEVISNLPLAPTPTAPFNGVHLPTDAHRQRLLREINDMLPRVEELGHRLSKRPKTQRRRRRLHGANPWVSYAFQTNIDMNDKEVPQGSEKVRKESQKVMWRCFACRASNESQLQECKVCQTSKHVLSSLSRPANSEMFRKRLQESVNNANAVPSPWIFVPGAMPLQPPLITPGPINGTNGILRRDHPKMEPNASSYQSEDGILHGANESHFGSPPLPDIKQKRYQHVELKSALQAMTLEDDYNGHSSEASQPVKRVPADSGNPYRQSASTHIEGNRRSPSSSGSNRTTSPIRLASSAPNGPASMEFSSQRLPSGIRHATSPPMTINHQRLAQSFQHMDARKEQDTFQAGPPPLMVGSFPGVGMFSSGLTYNTGSIQNQTDAVPQDVFQPQEPTPSGMSREQNVTPSEMGLNSAMDELAFGSYEAAEPRNRHSGYSRHTAPNPIAIVASKGNEEAQPSEITSLEALAAASDAANGGAGSATQESLRAVSAVVTPNRGQSGKQSRTNGATNGTYNMF